MKQRLCLLFLILGLFLIGGSQHARAQGVITGTVIDRDTREPLPGANVYLPGTVIGSVTNSAGVFRIRNAPAGTLTLVITMIGYERYTRTDIRVANNTTVTINAELVPTIIETTPIVITATKSERSLRDVPTSVSVMQAADIERRNAFTIDEVLRTVPGVHFNLSQINIRGSSGYSHGAGSRVLLLIDGVPVLSGDSGEITWEIVPLDQVERVEVVKGAGSTLYGSSALGGVVNIITRDLPETSVSSIRFQGGIYDKPVYERWRWSDRTRFSHTMQITHGREFGPLQVVGSLGTVYDDGYRQNDARRRTTGYLKSRYTFSPFSSITLTSFFIDQDRQNFLYWRSFDQALEPFEEQVGEEVASFRIQSSLQYRHVFGSESFMTVRGSWYHTDWKDNIGRDGNQSRADVVGIETQFSHALGQSHFLVGGVDISMHTVNSDIFGKRTGQVFAAYAQDEWRIARQLRLTGGIRFDITKLDTIDTFTNISPRAGIVYSVTDNLSFRASAGAGFRAPAAAEAFATTAASGLIVQPNPELDAERSWSFEIGGNANIAHWMNIDAALFQSDYWDMIEPIVTSIEPTGEINAQFVNVLRARVRGWETGITLSLFNRSVFPRFAYTYVDGEDVDSGNPLKYRHKHMVKTGMLMRYGIGWFEFDYRYMSEVENIDNELGIIIDSVEERVPVHVVDIGAGIDGMFAGIPLRMSVGVKNVLQYNYVEFVANVQPIRQYVATLQVVM
jgi:outer membrane receptor for ferrienterochelin and colicins